MRHACLALCVTIFLVSSATASDWKQFRGPGASGVSDDKNLPVEWSKTKNLRWKVALPGRGLSNPVIAKGRIYVTASSGWQQKRLHVLCFDEKTGKQFWERQFWATGHAQSHPKTSMAAPTPVTDGERVFALFSTFDLAALDKDGNLLWYRSLTGDYPTVGNNVGAAASPVLWNDFLLLAVENVGKSFALAVDKKTGQNRWRVARPRGINWITPLVLESGGRAQVIFQSPGDISGLDPKTGKQLWQLTGDGFSKIPSPVFAGSMILTQGPKFMAIRPGSPTTKPTVAWENRKLKCGYSSPLYYRGRVYALATRGVLKCADIVGGTDLWNQRLEGTFSASLVAGAGKLYAVNEEGATTVLEVGSKAKILAINRLKDTILATPVIANQAIYLRSDNYLYCIKKE